MAQARHLSGGNDTSKPKYYVLDMFPYPSGAGLHVGHPLGYIASDIVARYKRSQGLQRAAPDGLRQLRPAGGAIRHPDRTAPAAHHRAEHRALPRADGQHRVQLRLVAGGAHERSVIL
jgi:hypothetical protein